MQSSTAIAFRALVMLIVLISVPLFAIFGKNLPEVVKGLMEGRGLVLGPAQGGPQSTDTAAQPRPSSSTTVQPGPFRASSETTLTAGQPSPTGAQSPASTNGVGLPGSNLSSTGSTRSSAAAAADAPWKSPPPSARAGGLGAAAQPNGAQPAGFQTPIDAVPLSAPQSTPSDQFASAPASQFAAPSAAGPAPLNSRPSAIPAGPSYANASADKGTAGPASPLATSMSTDAKSASAGGQISAAPLPAIGDEKFRLAELRLRSLGATKYTLETWGPDNNRYRFACKMAIAGNANANRLFQAVEDDPWLAMESVLHQVEEWRSQSQQ
jgi:hypothetical protein